MKNHALRVLALPLFFVTSHLCSLECGIFAKNEGKKPVTKLVFFSERCSGSNYVQSLIQLNAKAKIDYDPFIHKHFPPWYDLPIEEYLGDPKHYTLDGTDEYLFIVVFRDPYDWARSLNMLPWYADARLFKLSFSAFIRAPWLIDYSDPTIVQNQAMNPLLDRNIVTEESFRNIFELRTAKIRNMFLMKDKVKNIYYVKYETVRDNSKAFLREIEALYNMPMNPFFTPVIFYKGDRSQGIYQEKRYDSISLSDLYYINSQLDETLENEIGYRLTYTLE